MKWQRLLVLGSKGGQVESAAPSRDWSVVLMVLPLGEHLVADELKPLHLSRHLAVDAPAQGTTRWPPRTDPCQCTQTRRPDALRQSPTLVGSWRPVYLATDHVTSMPVSVWSQPSYCQFQFSSVWAFAQTASFSLDTPPRLSFSSQFKLALCVNCGACCGTCCRACLPKGKL